VNLTGYNQYSKITSSIKNPKNLPNIEQKLIFIYPIIMSDKIKSKSVPDIQELIRDFISITFLTDLFVENTFSVVSAANQIRPLWDERNQPIDPTSGIIRAMAAMQGINIGGQGTAPNYNIDAGYSGLIQDKLNQKTAIIQQLVKVDPRFKKLKPYIETITMGNMIEVPVIVGTDLMLVDTLILMWVLIASIGLNITLDSTANIDKIFIELKNLDEKKRWILLNRLSTEQNIEQLGTWFQRGVIQTSRMIGTVTKKFNILPSVNTFALKKITDTNKEIEDEYNDFKNKHRGTFQSLLLKNDNLSVTQYFLKRAIDPTLREVNFGEDAIDNSTAKTSVYDTSIKQQSERYNTLLIHSFNETMSSVGSLLLSIIGRLCSSENSSIIIGDQQDKSFGKLFSSDEHNGINQHITKLFGTIHTAFSKEITETNIKALKDISSGSDITKAYDSIVILIASNKSIGGFIDNVIHEDNYYTFMEAFERLYSQCRSLNNKIQNDSVLLFTEGETKRKYIDQLTYIKNKINTSCLSFVNAFSTEWKELNHLNQGNIDYLITKQVKSVNNDTVMYKLIPYFHHLLTEVFYFLFLCRFQEIIYKYIFVIDVELEKSVNEVTNPYNFTLVLPVEIIFALHSAIMGKTWQSMLDKNMHNSFIKYDKSKANIQTNNIFNPNESYVKGIVNYISKRLKVPNLIVIDSARDDIYYKLMNQTTMNKIKIQTMSTFIQSKLNRPLNQSTAQYGGF